MKEASPLSGHPAAPSLHAVEAALDGALMEWSRNVCTHEDTYRGGVLWTICRNCHAKWADDEGGMPEWKKPDRIATAYSVLARVRAAIAKASA